MASSSFLLPLSLLLLLSPAALSATCKSHKFATPKKTFAACADLPHLSAALHYTFDAAKSTLAVAFTAPPSAAGGWVAWALNPTADGMAGAQTLVAYAAANGSVAVGTYDISSYSDITPGPLSYKVSGLGGEAAAGKITLFATWQLPAGNTEFNQVWQVGAAVKNGFPAKHDFKPENLAAKAVLKLSSAAANSPAGAPASAPAAAGGPSAAVSPSGSSAAAAATSPAPASGKNAAGERVRGLAAFMGLAFSVFSLFF